MPRQESTFNRTDHDALDEVLLNEGVRGNERQGCDDHRGKLDDRRDADLLRHGDGVRIAGVLLAEFRDDQDLAQELLQGVATDPQELRQN